MLHMTFESQSLTDEIIYTSDIAPDVFEYPWLIIYYSPYYGYQAKGFAEKENAQTEFSKMYLHPEVNWRMHGFYENKKPCTISITFEFEPSRR